MSQHGQQSPESSAKASAGLTPADKTAPVPVSTVFEELVNLTRLPKLEVMLSKALGIIVRTFGAEAGSMLFNAHPPRVVRAGAFRQEALTKIRYWEEAIGHRLQKSNPRLTSANRLPISVVKIARPGLLLVNAPLLSDARTIAGSLSLVLPPGQSLTLQKRQLLKRLTVSVGILASQKAHLELARQRLKQMNLFYEVGQALMTTLDINRLLSDTMKLATEVIDAGAASLMLIDETNEELVFEVTLGSRGHMLRQQRIPLDEGIAGWVARHGKPAIVNDARTDPRFSHRVDVRTGFLTQSIAAVPLKIKGRVIGVLEVLNKYADNGFDEEDIQIMSVIAAQAAIAIENARLYQQVRQERDHILKAQEEVRHELNRKLHDGPVQLLSAISISLDHLERMSKVKPDALDSAFEALRNLVGQAIKETRTILFELRPVILETQGLVAALRQYVNRLQDSESFSIHFKTVDRVELSPNVAGTVFSIVQEAINNIKRHAKARNVWLSVETRHHHCIVTIRDDGRGFDIQKIEADYDGRGKFGLLNMRERAALIDADLRIESRTAAPNRGTTVQIIIPLPSPSKSGQSRMTESGNLKRSSGHRCR